MVHIAQEVWGGLGGGIADENFRGARRKNFWKIGEKYAGFLGGGVMLVGVRCTHKVCHSYHKSQITVTKK